ncbi:MAG: hypothetical protein AAF497_28380 [Planctomycetota bacterium]
MRGLQARILLVFLGCSGPTDSHPQSVQFPAEFDVIFLTCNKRETPIEVVNPFTGKRSLSSVGKVNDKERRSLIHELEIAGESISDVDGHYELRVAGEVVAVVDFDGLNSDENFNAGSVAIRRMSPMLAERLYSLADAGNLSIHPAMKENPVLVTKVEKAELIRSRYEHVTVVDTPEKLLKVLSDGMDQARQYRKQTAD